jgi:hypothetical protein
VEADIGRASGRLAQFAPRANTLARNCGIALTLLGGPAGMAVAYFVLGMGTLESGAVLLLLSGWLGPRLMNG